MLRLNDIQLPLHHREQDLPAAIIQRLDLREDQLLGFTVFKRSHDARKKSNILLIYQLDVELSNQVEEEVLAKFAGQSLVRLSPDTSYRFVANAPDNFPKPHQQRPIVIGFGPCGILAALVLAQMGLKPNGTSLSVSR